MSPRVLVSPGAGRASHGQTPPWSTHTWPPSSCCYRPCRQARPALQTASPAIWGRAIAGAGDPHPGLCSDAGWAARVASQRHRDQCDFPLHPKRRRVREPGESQQQLWLRQRTARRQGAQGQAKLSAFQRGKRERHHRQSDPAALQQGRERYRLPGPSGSRRHLGGADDHLPGRPAARCCGRHRGARPRACVHQRGDHAVGVGCRSGEPGRDHRRRLPAAVRQPRVGRACTAARR